jgi:predicted PurR-regulated permease PerM
MTPPPAGSADGGGVPASPQPAGGKERVVTFRPRMVLVVLGVVLAVAIALRFVLVAKHGITIIAIALFLAVALNPAVEFFQRRGLSRGSAVGSV